MQICPVGAALIPADRRRGR